MKRKNKMADNPSLEELIAGLDASEESIQDVGELQDDISDVGDSEQVPESLKDDIVDQVESMETGDDIDALADIISAGAVDNSDEFVDQIKDDMSQLIAMQRGIMQQQNGDSEAGFDPVTGDSNRMFINIDDDAEIPLYGGAEIPDDEIDYTGRSAEEIVHDLQQNVLELLELLKQ